ncbi:hypothetical protein ACQKOF_11235 [Lysinibacillus sp. NPDC093190]|uniref:hypothetical protein n=1 Tax=Lysinibacillus sp. NPDC093190 TaxID=3390575 RepID=UPI003D04C6F3
MGISDRGTKAKTITSCDNAFVTNIGAAAASLSRKKHLLARDLERASRVKRLIGRPQEALLCAKAKRQQQMFYLCESEVSATNVFCSESEASATNVFCSESEASATKRPVGTEITPSFCGKALFYLI